MTLTVKEKEHWKNRISSRIDRAIEDIYRREGSQKKVEIQQKSRQRALDVFAIRDKIDRIRSLEEKIDLLGYEKRSVNEEVLNHLTALGHTFGYGTNDHRDLNAFIKTHAELCERDVLLDTEFGRKIVRLREEQDQLLDTVWLATSSKQIKRLWTELASLLGEQPTELQQQALKSDPDSSTE